MQVTITGGFGFVGSLCADFFRKNGHKVTIVSRKVPDSMSNWSKGFTVVKGDVTDKSVDITGDLVIHCASLNETKNFTEDEFMRVNADGTRNVIESAARNSVGTFVKLSTFHVYGKTSGVVDEKTEPDPKSFYAKSMLAGDQICGEYTDDIDVAIVRLSNLFGPPVHPSVDRWTLAVNNFCLQASKNGNIKMNSKGTQKRDFISTSNAVSAINAVSSARKTGEVFNAGGENVMSIKEIAERIASNFQILYGKRVQVYAGESEEQAGDLVYKIDKIKELGYVPRKDTDRTIKEILEVCDHYDIGSNPKP